MKDQLKLFFYRIFTYFCAFFLVFTFFAGFSPLWFFILSLLGGFLTLHFYYTAQDFSAKIDTL